jgi:translation initiation factor 1
MEKRTDLYTWAYRDPGTKPAGPPGGRRPQVRLERKGRGGKTVTVVEHLALSDDELRALLRRLQQVCGTGGTCKEHHLELQGDFQTKVRDWLRQHGFGV